MKLPEYTPKGNESSDSGTTLNSGGSDVEDITNSDLESEYVPSETSEDREFVVSDSESLSGVSIRSSDPEGSGYNILNDEIGDVVTKQSIKGIKALKTITKRTVNLNGRQVIQYLVLWYSWETAETAPH
ncbi:uncharacterized protein N7506_000254 [Penicillium brevicompactum]|uniref:Uncharacterized protein n=1 Tax=Penicillium brevicompactum TaxID=5074 RepID=A0A9W9ULG3_PENBR|nr:uncharacterized protein N7506_000254 [Penicillium brevicompactum]KAJ5346178.1 hypothetical protein N7452_004182 [Penicillium brevicompactum]KAJ5347001.1 hypothetical protein N7506_000254 [Penicillium brevicompactum]